nr:SGNH/GDSL hydrolase family protein [Gemmatimonadaceae bacterium]
MIDLVTRRARDVRRAVRPVVLALVVALAPLRAIAQQPFTSLTFFGDSYSDTGNLSRLTFGIFPLPPYAPGRFSNGPIWVDRFAQLAGRPQDARPQFFDRGRSGNYAFAGAQTTNTGLGSPSSGLQVINYLTRPGATAQTRTDPTGLYSLFIGGN